MADASHPFDARRRRPRDWGEALAALPLETPPLSVWTQIAARLDGAATDSAAPDASDATAIDDTSAPSAAPSAMPQRRRAALSLRSWLALAASLSALALLPAVWFAGRDDGADPAPVATITSPAPNTAMASASRRVADVSRTDPTRVETATQVASVVREGLPAIETSPIQTATAEAQDASATMPVETAPLSAAPQMASVAPPTVSSTPLVAEIEDTTNARDALPPGAVLVGDADADATGREMEMLYAASAQLETLLTYTHDPRVESGPAAALASQIHTRLAKIDARLALPGLSSHEQYALWQARVGTLRQALAFESEQRALAAEGQVYEGELVEVY